MSEKKLNKLNKILLPGFLAAIMVLSVIGFALTNKSDEQAQTGFESYTYQGKEYTFTQNGWAVEVDGQYALFSYGPRDLESINLGDIPLTSKVYLAYNPDSKSSNVDFIIQKLNNILLYKGIRPVTSCTVDSPKCPNIPIAACNSNDQVIVIIEEASLDISQQDKCLYIKGSSTDLNKATDKLAMQWMGLI